MEENTRVDDLRLLAAVWEAGKKPPPELESGVDYYCTVVAQAADLPAEEVQARLLKRDKGIMLARNLVKTLLFACQNGMRQERTCSAIFTQTST
jgi:hypothetical protein